MDPKFKQESIGNLTRKVNELKSKLGDLDPEVLAVNTGAQCFADGQEYKKEFRLSFFGKPVNITFPDFYIYNPETKSEYPVFLQALLLYYFVTADGVSEKNEWISFSDLPEGKIYNQAFQGYSGNKLLREVGNDIEAFKKAAQDLGGITDELGDASFSFQVLPKVSLLVVYWKGDEDFPPNAQVLFDQSIEHYLPTDVCSIAGNMLISKLINKLK